MRPQLQAARLLGLASLVALSLACAALWNVGNRDALKSDVLEVLEQDVGDAPRLDCRMIGATRSGYCVGDMTMEWAAAVAESLGLAASTVNLADRATVPPLASDGDAGCLDPEAFAILDGLPAWWIGGRPVALSLSSGGQFEYLVLVVNPMTGKACVQVSYAYG